MLRFSERNRLRTAYYVWLSETRKTTPVADCPETFIVFLLTHGLMEDEKVRKFLEKSA